MILMFRVTSSFPVFVVRRSSSLFFLFKIRGYFLRYKERIGVAFIHRMDEFACLYQYNLALCSQPQDITRQIKNFNPTRSMLLDKRNDAD